MSLSQQWLDELRQRTSLSAVIGRTVKLVKKGNEHQACCPFHNEKTPSFTVSDDKGFYHCFGCGAHGDAIRWLIDGRGLAFLDAVSELAAAAGMDLPARSPESAKRDEDTASAAETLGRAAQWYAKQLAGAADLLEQLSARGIGPEQIERFQLGFAPPRKSVTGCGAAQAGLVAAGLLKEDGQSGLYRDHFRNRITIPIHDARGRMAGFAARLADQKPPGSAPHANPADPGGRGNAPKYINSPESDHFAKGDLLFNLHRAAPAARAARRLVIVEGQFDTIALDRAGIAETVAPGGTALTERQLERAWRVAHTPILLFDGDEAGRKAALRACERAMEHLGPGKSLLIASCPDGEDPDGIIRKAPAGVDGAFDKDAARAAIEALLTAAKPVSAWVYERVFEAASPGPPNANPGPTPEQRASLWKRLAELAGAIRDEETRAQYLADWRSRFDTSFPPLPPGLTEEDMLPDGRVAGLSGLEGEAQDRLREVTKRWLERSAEHAGDSPTSAGRWAWELGRRVAAGLIDGGDANVARAKLEKPLQSKFPGYSLDDYRRSFDIGMKRGFDLSPLLLDMRCAGFERTDMGNAERWHARFGQDYLYTTAKGWLGWDGRRYRVLNQEKDTIPAEVLASVFETVRAIQNEAYFVRNTGFSWKEEFSEAALERMEEDPRRDGGMDRLVRSGRKVEPLSDKLAAWGRSSEASGRIGCIASLAKRWVTVELSEFDTDPMLLNCLNGTLRFYRGAPGEKSWVELKPHDRADRLTKLTACVYDPDAPAPLFQKLVRWAQPDGGRRRYLRQWLGYNLTGDMGEQIFQIWYGPLAANGKSTVGNVCREAVGDYGQIAAAETFLDTGVKKRGDAATPDLVQLPGARCVTSGEPPEGLKINEALINTVTGGDPMKARDNFRSFFEFAPIFKWTLWCNLLPPIPRGTAGIWRRVKVMPWEQHLEPHERDRDLPKKLRGEYSGILAWMVRGLIDWMENGFVEPQSVQLASEEYKHDSDPVSSFLQLCTVPDPAGRVQSSHLYELFCAWAKAAGENEWKQKGFSIALKNKGLASKASNGMHWLGIRTIRAPGDFIDQDGKVRSLDAIADADSAASPAPPEDNEDDDLLY